MAHLKDDENLDDLNASLRTRQLQPRKCTLFLQDTYRNITILYNLYNFPRKNWLISSLICFVLIIKKKNINWIKTDWWPFWVGVLKTLRSLTKCVFVFPHQIDQYFYRSIVLAVPVVLVSAMSFSNISIRRDDLGLSGYISWAVFQNFFLSVMYFISKFL